MYGGDIVEGREYHIRVIFKIANVETETWLKVRAVSSEFNICIIKKILQYKYLREIDVVDFFCFSEEHMDRLSLCFWFFKKRDKNYLFLFKGENYEFRYKI